MLPFPHLPQQAEQAHFFLDLNGQALLSIGTFCNAGCTAEFTATTVTIPYQGNTVLEGAREPLGLWTTTLSNSAANGQANATHTDHIKANAISFLHVACFSPTTDTWIKAINQGFFKSWPAITATDVKKHLPKSLAMSMGHLDQQRKNFRSTKRKPSSQENTDEINDTNPPMEQKHLRKQCTAKLRQSTYRNCLIKIKQH
jgi:hypothetical protein